MSSAHPPGPQAGWEPEPAAVPLKMPPASPALNTVNLSAISATLTTGAGASPAYSSTSSPYARGSSTHSSPCAISRTGSGASDASRQPSVTATPSATPCDLPTVAVHSGELTAASLQALSQQASLVATTATAVGDNVCANCSSSQHGASTPLPGHSNLEPSTGCEGPISLEASLQGLAINGVASPDAPTPLNFHAPPSSALPQQPPVEVFARFPQEQAAFGHPNSQHHGHNGNGPQHGSHYGGGAAAYLPSAAVALGAAAPYTPAAPPPAGGPLNGSYAPPGMAAHQPPFYGGSPPGGYGMAMYHPGPPPHGTGVPAVSATAGFTTAAYYPQPMNGPVGQQGHAGYTMMTHPGAYYGMVPQPYPQPPGSYGVYAPPLGMGGERGGGKGAGAAYEAAEYARQYQAMMSYMQGFGMMVSPSGSPERMSRPGSQPSFRRTSSQERQDGRGRLSGRPSRLSLDMSASKSENGDAHRLDPELAPLVVEDKSELQSELLEEFKASRDAGSASGRHWTLRDLRGQLYPFCRDQHGSRLVQQQLENAEPEEMTELFGEVRHKLLPLMVDVFGNYVVQRFLERGDPAVQAAVADAIRGKVLPLSLQMYGCRVVQKALEVLPQGERISICGELTEHTLRCVRDQNGNHVVQKCIESVQPSEPARAMIEIIVSKGQSLSTHTFGCRLVQRVLEFCSIAELHDRVVADVLDNALQLSHDQYGNYVVQHLVAKGPQPAREAIVAKVVPQVMTLAQHKYASNVVEACLKHGAQPHRDAIVDQMISEGGPRPAALTALMRDQYGNYVVQRCLEVATRHQRATLLRIIKPHLDTLKKYTYGKHIVSKAEAMLAVQAAEEEAEAQGGEQQAPEEQQVAGVAHVPLPVPAGAVTEAQQ